ncbi:MAG: (2Fe-2S)-binding protein [Deltaproteobacteria bacterium]|nr:(2Fe-2S)-binding protein [Deltaproteobacteria bacterium]
MRRLKKKRPLALTVNGEPVEWEVEPHWTLLRFIRDELKLKGAKEGCGEGECGTCVVILDGRAVNACLLLALQARGGELWTIEGLGTPERLHPLQQAFIERGGIQCGICTPGMIMAAKALLDRNPTPTREEIKVGISGNLCRCTGYVKIVDAVEAVAHGEFGPS